MKVFHPQSKAPKLNSLGTSPCYDIRIELIANATSKWYGWRYGLVSQLTANEMTWESLQLFTS